MKRPLTFVDGIGVGVGAIAMLPVLYFAINADTFEAMYRDIGHVALPLVTRIVLSPVWRLGVPAALVAGFVVALASRPHRFVTLVVAIAAIGAAIVWYLGLYAPIFALAGNISG